MLRALAGVTVTITHRQQVGLALVAGMVASPKSEYGGAFPTHVLGGDSSCVPC